MGSLQFQYLSRIRESHSSSKIFADDDKQWRRAMTTMQIIFSLSLLASTQSRSSGRHRLVYIVDVVFVDFDFFFDVKNDQRSSAQAPSRMKMKSKHHSTTVRDEKCEDFLVITTVVFPFHVQPDVRRSKRWGMMIMFVISYEWNQLNRINFKTYNTWASPFSFGPKRLRLKSENHFRLKI